MEQHTITNPTTRVDACAICGFDLSGQVAEYVPEYHLMSVRCPECGQKQPSGMGARPWKYRRLKAFVMRTWWLAIFSVVMFGSLIALTAMAQSTAYASLQWFDRELYSVYAESMAERGTYVGGSMGMVDVDWWERGGEALAADRFDLWGHVDWIVLTDWLWFVLIGPVIALLARIVLVGASRWAQALVLGLPIVGALGLVVLYMESPIYYTRVAPVYLSMEIGGYWIGIPTVVVGALSILVSYRYADRVLRWVSKRIPRISGLLVSSR